MAKARPKEPAPTGPNVQDVDALFSELIPDRYSRKSELENDPEVIRAAGLVALREKDLEKDAKLKELKSALRETERRVHERKCTIANKAEAVRREYRAKGLTDEVAQKLAKLVDEVNKG